MLFITAINNASLSGSVWEAALSLSLPSFVTLLPSMLAVDFLIYLLTVHFPSCLFSSSASP